MPQVIAQIVTTMLLLALTMSAHGATFNVVDVRDYADVNVGDGVCDVTESQTSVRCTLRAAIQEANLTEEDDLIIMSDGDHVMTISDLAGPEDEGATGDFDITNPFYDEDEPSTHYVTTIVGNAENLSQIGYNDPRVGYTGVGRVFDIHKGATVVIENVHMRYGFVQYVESPNGLYLNTEGGCIRSRSATLILRNVEITKCMGAGFGSGIYSEMGYLELENTRVFSNREMAELAVNLSNVGNGIAINGGEAFIKSSQIWDNPQQHESGFPRQIGAPAWEVLDRFATDSATMGGGIYSFGDVTIEDSLIYGNRAMQDGGGIYHGVGELTIKNTTIAGNSAGRGGGGIFLLRGYVGEPRSQSDIPVHLVHTTIIDNYAVGTDLTSEGVYTGQAFGGYPGTTNYGVLRGHDVAIEGQLENQAVLQMANSIIGECEFFEGEIKSLGHNISSTNTCGLSVEPGSTDLVNTDPMLEALDTNFTTYLHSYKPMINSPALDGASEWYCRLAPADQRGIPRPPTQCDIGAHESASFSASNQVYVLNVGEGMSAQLTTNYPGWPYFSYEIVARVQPEKGKLSFFDPGDIGYENGKFVFSSYLELSGNPIETFTFRATDTISGATSEAEITIHINTDSHAGPVLAQEDIVVDVINGEAISDITIINQEDLSANVADVDYDFPFGVFFFDVEPLSLTYSPTYGNGISEVEMLLPIGATFQQNPVVRKMDRFGNWRTLPTSGEEGSAWGPSFGSFSYVPHPDQVTYPGVQIGRIFLHLVDNDIFDFDRNSGVISDPVAIAIPNDLVDANGDGWKVRQDYEKYYVREEPKSSGRASLDISMLIVLMFSVLVLRSKLRS